MAQNRLSVQSNDSLASIDEATALQLESQPEVAVTLITGEVIHYENVDGIAVSNDDETISASSEIADLIESYQGKVENGAVRVDPAVVTQSSIVSGTSIKTQGTGITPTVCSFKFIICWRENVNSVKWPNQRISYSYGNTVTAAQRIAINNAIFTWNQRVLDVQYVLSPTTANRVVFNIVNLPNNVQGNSPVGRSSTSASQNINYDPAIFGSAFERGVILHEMAHSAGLIHEHQRCDRDAYITVVNANADTLNFGRRCEEGVKTYTNYDYDSVMQYAAGTYGTPSQTVVQMYLISASLT